MLLWFFATSITAVSFVFHDPRIDYRLVMLGSIVPDVVDIGFGGARVGHSLAFAVVVFLIVVLATTNRRGQRRRWLALPIGMSSTWFSTARGHTPSRSGGRSAGRGVMPVCPAWRGVSGRRHGGRGRVDPGLGLVPVWAE